MNKINSYLNTLTSKFKSNVEMKDVEMKNLTTYRMDIKKFTMNDFKNFINIVKQSIDYLDDILIYINTNLGGILYKIEPKYKKFLLFVLDYLDSYNDDDTIFNIDNFIGDYTIFNIDKINTTETNVTILNQIFTYYIQTFEYFILFLYDTKKYEYIITCIYIKNLLTNLLQLFNYKNKNYNYIFSYNFYNDKTYIVKNLNIKEYIYENNTLDITKKNIAIAYDEITNINYFINGVTKMTKMPRLGGKNKSNYKKTDKKITVIYKKKKYTRVIYINERKKYIKINKTYMLLSKLKKDIK
jgi:hypothetical protein